MTNKLIGLTFVLLGSGMAWAGYRLIRRYDGDHPPGSVTFTAPLGPRHRALFLCGLALLVVGLVLAIVIGGIFFFV